VDDSRPTLTVEETAKLLGISRGLAFQAVRRGDIPAIRIGRRILVPLAQLQALLNGDGAYAPAAPSAGGRRDTSGERRGPGKGGSAANHADAADAM